MQKKIIFSKQSDHDLDIAPLWLHWYTKVFKADTIIVTPVQTSRSSIKEITKFYQKHDVMVYPIIITEWEEEPIWNAQLDTVESVLQGNTNFIVLSADADQFFEPIAGQITATEVVYQRINMVSEVVPTVSTVGETKIEAHPTYILIAGFVNSLDNSAVWLTGHFDGSMKDEPSSIVRREFHLCLRGYEHFLKKFSALAIKDDGTEISGGWKKLRKALETGGVERFKEEYTKWAKWVGEDPASPEFADFFKSYFSHDTSEAPRKLPLFPFLSSLVEPTVRIKIGGQNRDIVLAVPRGELELLNIFQGNTYAFPELFRQTPPKFIVDIGAGIGVAAAFFKSLFSAATIHCFEPESGNFAILSKNAMRFQNIICHSYGLADSDEVRTLHLNRARSMEHSFTVPSAHSKVEVQLYTADSKWDELNISEVDLLRLNGYGFGAEILSSLGPRLNKIRVIIAYFQTEAERRAIDQSLTGFKLYAVKNIGATSGLAHYVALP